jgi:hypothetical protein
MTLEIRATKSLTDSSSYIDQKLLEYNKTIAQWLESEIIRSAKMNRLDHLSLSEQVRQLQELGYQQRIYPDASIHWGRISTVTNEWFDISVLKIEMKVTP